MQQKLKFKAIFIGDRYEVVEVTTHTHKCTHAWAQMHISHTMVLSLFILFYHSHHRNCAKYLTKTDEMYETKKDVIIRLRSVVVLWHDLGGAVLEVLLPADAALAPFKYSMKPFSFRSSSSRFASWFCSFCCCLHRHTQIHSLFCINSIMQCVKM